MNALAECARPPAFRKRKSPIFVLISYISLTERDEAPQDNGKGTAAVDDAGANTYPAAI